MLRVPSLRHLTNIQSKYTAIFKDITILISLQIYFTTKPNCHKQIEEKWVVNTNMRSILNFVKKLNLNNEGQQKKKKKNNKKGE